jgi:hypothetical protein
VRFAGDHAREAVTMCESAEEHLRGKSQKIVGVPPFRIELTVSI